jgi:hypothetical protein
MKNLIQTQLSQTDRDKIDQIIQQLETELNGKTVALTEEERSRYGSINEQNKLLVNKTREYRQNSPELSSSDVDWDEFEADYGARQFLETRSDRLLRIAHRMQSTKILHDYDNYQDALRDYAYAQYKRGAGEEGFPEKVAEMKLFFPKSGKSGQTHGGGDGGTGGGTP